MSNDKPKNTPENSASKIPLKRLVIRIFHLLGSVYLLTFLSFYNGVATALRGEQSAAWAWVCVLTILGANSAMEQRIQAQKEHNDFLYNHIMESNG